MERTRRTKKDEVQTAEEIVTVRSSIAQRSSEERVEHEKLHTIKVRKFVTEPAYVRVNAGVTKNMGNYESLRLDVSLSVPCYVEEMGEVVEGISGRVSEYLEEELDRYGVKD